MAVADSEFWFLIYRAGSLLFIDAIDYRAFLETLAEAYDLTGPMVSLCPP
jgi:hypothetical protein